jgi:peptidoglycan/xylan/chitin deacetylase (PgdA/CDA1 family)
MATYDFVEAYQWNYRPQVPGRPAWFGGWPNGAKVAVPIIVLHEWESVPWHRARPMPANAHYTFDFLALGAREYGARHGVWRLLDVLDKHQIKATMLVNGLVAELFPESVAEITRRGHELATHQWDQSVFPPMFRSREEERESLVRSIDALEKVGGVKIAGYMSPGPRATPLTLELCAELGITWTCDFNDSDIPYVIDVGGKKLVSVGYTVPGYTDADIIPLGLDGGLRQLKLAFDATYEEAQLHPMKFCYAVHVHWGGTPGMAQLFDEFLRYVSEREGVWFPKCIDIAQFWMANNGH